MTLFAQFYRMFQWAPTDLADMLPWYISVAPGVVLLKEHHALARSYRMRGIDWIGEDDTVKGSRMMQANDILKNLRGSWMLQAEAQRRRVHTIPARASTLPVATLVENEQRTMLLGDPDTPETGCYETQYYCTLTWVPPESTEKALRHFIHGADDFMAHLRGLLAEMEPLNTRQQLSYFQSTVGDAWFEVAPPVPGTNISRYLRTVPWSAGSFPDWDSRLGRWHVRILSLTGYPASSHADMMRRLDTVPVEYRWVTKWAGIDQHLQGGILYKRQHDWLANETSIVQEAQRGLGIKEDDDIIRDASASYKASLLNKARVDVEEEIYGVGEFATAIMTWGGTADEADVAARQIQHILQSSGFVVKREGDYGERRIYLSRFLSWLVPPHTTAIWLSMHPGNTMDGKRSVLQSTITMAHLMPGLRSTWTGTRDNLWFTAKTGHTNLVHIPRTVRDLGHHGYLGPTRSGKSVQACLNLFEWFLTPNSQAVTFDVGRSARLPTLLLGGQWLDVGDSCCRLQPLRDIDHPQEIGWALSWLCRLLDAGGIEPTAVVQEYLSNRLKELAEKPQGHRTMSALLHVCEAHSRRTEPAVMARTDREGLAVENTRLASRAELYRNIQRTIRIFTTQGPYGGILDGSTDVIEANPVLCFEQQSLSMKKALVPAVIQYCFHAIERRFSTDRPMRLVFEEAALVAMDSLYRDKFDVFAMTAAKAGVSLGLVINSLQQKDGFGLGRLNDENTPIWTYTANIHAQTEQTAPIYRRFGLSDAEIQLIARMRPYEDVYWVCRELGSRVLHRKLTPLLKDCIGRNTDADHDLMDHILNKEGPEGFAASWLTRFGHTEAAQELRKDTTCTPSLFFS